MWVGAVVLFFRNRQKFWLPLLLFTPFTQSTRQPSFTHHCMSYCATIKSVIRCLNDLGPDLRQDQFNGLYGSIVWYWFPTSRGYIISYRAFPLGEKSRNLELHHGGLSNPNPILVVKFKRPSKWTAAGRQTVMDELASQIKKGPDHSQYSTFFGLEGLACIGWCAKWNQRMISLQWW